MVRELLSLIIAGGAFCGSHVLLSSTRLRGSLRDQLGERGFLAVYSVTALVIFAWFVSAYASAPTIVLWPISHVIANGDVASVLFFGALAALALGGTVLIDRKKQLALGSNWPRLAEVTSNVPFAALLAGRTRLRWRDVSLLRVAAGLLFYAVLYLAHPIITGLPVVVP